MADLPSETVSSPEPVGRRVLTLRGRLEGAALGVVSGGAAGWIAVLVAGVHGSMRWGLIAGIAALAAALGYLGNPNHADVQQAIGDIFACAERHRRSVGILAPVEADARRYLEQGACFVAVGSDQALLQAATQTLPDRFREP